MDRERLTISQAQATEFAYTNGAAETISTSDGWQVIRRNHKTIAFDSSRIASAIQAAFRAYEEARGSVQLDPLTKYAAKITEITAGVVTDLSNRYPDEARIHIEEIQDIVVRNLIRYDEPIVATLYSNYRDGRANARNEENLIGSNKYPQINVTVETGSQPFNWHSLEVHIQEACRDLTGVDPAVVLERLDRSVYDGIALEDFQAALIRIAGDLIEVEPNYRYFAGRLLLTRIRREVAEKLQINVLGQPVLLETQESLEDLYSVVFKTAIEFGIEKGHLNPELAEFDLDYLGRCLKADLDFNFDYVGLQTIYDRYLLRHDSVIYELPQVLFMRVAMGVALNEENREEAAASFYALLSNFDYMSSTPTLFNSGTVRSQLSSCYLSTVSDDLPSIMGAIADNAMLAKWAGGLGNDWTQVRSKNSFIKGTNGLSRGVVPFLNIVDATAVAVNQGGKRNGAVCVYLENWHLDFEAFLDLRKNTGDDRQRTHDTNTAAWIPDLFMKRVAANTHWTLFSPNDVPDLHDLYGKAFDRRYKEYERQTETGEIELFKRVPAVQLWQKMLSTLYETGHPWITFKDPANIRSPQRHIGVVHSSNLCTEITLNTSADEIAVCNLGSVNLANHIDEFGVLDEQKLENTVRLAIRMLDNVIDINYYAVKTAENSNKRHRPIGLGIMGFQDALFKQRLPYSSQEAVEFADEITEKISYYAIDASSNLASERGAYESFEGSLWSQGILPIDSLKLLAEERAEEEDSYFDVDMTERMDWDSLREKVKTQGMRNSNTLAIAPTATIGLISGVCASIEPLISNLYAKDNLSGKFPVMNHYLVKDLKELGLWNQETATEIKRDQGQIGAIESIPVELKELYKSAFEVEPRWLIESASRRQKWLDQSQSLNLYFQPPKQGRIDGKILDLVYSIAWQSGLKTTYYLREREASGVERVTVEDRALNAVAAHTASSVDSGEPTHFSQAENDDLAHLGEADIPLCLVEDPDCEACQ